MTVLYAEVTYDRVNEGDMADLTEYFRNIFQSYGITGRDLDFAIADCLRPSLRHIQAHRAATTSSSSVVELRTGKN